MVAERLNVAEDRGTDVNAELGSARVNGTLAIPHRSLCKTPLQSLTLTPLNFLSFSLLIQNSPQSLEKCRTKGLSCPAGLCVRACVLRLLPFFVHLLLTAQTRQPPSRLNDSTTSGSLRIPLGADISVPPSLV